MTMPNERTRALRWAEEFLREVMESPECPTELRQQAKAILRHYPEPHSIAHEARYSHEAHYSGTARAGTPWLGPEDQYEAPRS